VPILVIAAFASSEIRERESIGAGDGSGGAVPFVAEECSNMDAEGPDCFGGKLGVDKLAVIGGEGVRPCVVCVCVEAYWMGAVAAAAAPALCVRISSWRRIRTQR
jgi:hypothetical protein